MAVYDVRNRRCTAFGLQVLGSCVLLVSGVAGCLTGGTEEAFCCRRGPIEALTSGEGNDTEAAWSPDGQRIAFQTDRKGDLDIAVLDLRSRKVTGAVEGSGHACYPAWTPAGALVYAFGQRPETAVQAATANAANGFGLCVLENGDSRALTQGCWRDYTPSVSADGRAVYYASTRGNTENSASLWRLPLTTGGVAECVLHLDGPSSGAVQPSLAPNGKILLWSQLDGFRNNWRLHAGRPEDPANSVALTTNVMSAYAPRWSPDGRHIAFTGFRRGDPGWGVYVLEPRSGAMTRLNTGVGNSRSPVWSPDGHEVVFENNRTGFYKLYRVRIVLRPVVSGASVVPAPATTRVEACLAATNGLASLICARGAVPGHVQGNVAWVPGGGLEFGENGAVTFEIPTGLDFGSDAFYVRMTLSVREYGGGPRVAAVGQYAEHPLGWQLFVNDTGHICFSARDPNGLYVGVAADKPVKRGTVFTVVGQRDAEGRLKMWLDGVLQAGRAAGAGLAYGPAQRVCLGRQGGGARFSGKVMAFDSGRGDPAGVKRAPTREELFAEVVP